MRFLATCIALSAAAAASAQPPAEPDPQALREKMSALSRMDGVWRGSAWTLGRDGRTELTQTERVGPMLDGVVRVVEGRGYDESGKTVFNAFGVISYDAAGERYVLRSHTGGRQGEFELTVDDEGYSWEIPAGPGTVRYRADIDETSWVETGTIEMPGREPTQIFEMKLTRVGDTTWPAGDPVPAE